MVERGQARLAERADEGLVPHGPGSYGVRPVEVRPVGLGRIRIARQPLAHGAEAANGVAAVPVDGERHDGGEAERVARRWQGFLALAIARGVPPEAISARFTEEDIDDLCAPEHEDEMLVRCLDTLVTAWHRERAQPVTAAVDPDEPVVAPPTVRCANCRHFRRRPAHPHLGDCGGEGTRTAAAGFWDDQERGCEAFARRL